MQSNIESGSTQVTAADIQPAEREVEVVNVPIDMPPKASLNSGGDNAQASSSSSATRSDTVQRAQALNLAMT